MIPMPIRLLAFSGSSRRDSVNRRLLARAVAIARSGGATVTELLIGQDLLPLYDGDLEDAHGLPAAASDIKAQFAQHDGLIIASPEYNGFFSPLLKNTIDWVSRPVAGAASPFAGKTAMLLGASPGALGGIRGLPHLRLLLSNLGVTVAPGQMALGGADKAFAPDGSLSDAGQASMLDKCVADMLRLTAALKAAG